MLGTLEKYFGYKEFRDGQAEIVDSILGKNNTLVVMPTGSGKSLCYQLPALMMPGTAIVISPLIALMKDQYDSLMKLNYPATFLNSTLSKAEAAKRLQLAQHGGYKLLYIAPERLSNEYFIHIISNLKVSFLAIDEAHCISEWGHDFRPAYLNIAKALQNAEISHTVALTATATPTVQKDIVSTLKMTNPKVIVKGFDRNNLQYYTEYTIEKKERLVDILLQQKHGTITYCGTQKQTEIIYNYLSHNKILLNNGVRAIFYHAGLSSEIRRQNQEMFINDEVNVIVATNAFGMGINKSNVRNIVHLSLPGSIEAYYQEAGRAGRDGLPANCYLLYNSSDKKLQQWFIEHSFPTKEEFELVYNYIQSAPKSASRPGSKADVTVQDIAGGVNVNSISVALHLEPHTVAKVLKQLVTLGVVEVNNFPQNPKMIWGYPNKRAALGHIKTTTPVFDALIRSCTDESYRNFVPLDIEYLSRKYNILPKDFVIGLNDLCKMGIITMENSRPLGTISTITAGAGSSAVFVANSGEFAGVPFELWEKRRGLLYEKFYMMHQYATTTQCKRNFILNYFADTSYQGVCGKCSSCLGKNKLIGPEMPEDRAINILSAAVELNGRFGCSTLHNYLKGAWTIHTDKYDLHKGTYFGFLKATSDTTINNVIDECIETGLLACSNDKYRLVQITNKGRKFISKNIKPLVLNKSKDFSNSKKDWHIDSSAKNTKSALPDMALALKINSLFCEGYSLEEIVKKLSISKGMVGTVLESAIEMKLIKDHKPYCNKELLDKITLILRQRPGIILRDIHKTLELSHDFALLRIIVAFAKNG